MDWRVGCSGFSYSDWKDTFYPKGLPRSKWFDYYSEKFSTLELNVTFYRFPRLNFLQNWYDKSPDGFKFAVKAPRAITHFKQFTDTATMLADFYGTVKEGLKDKLGCILFQLPASAKYSEHLLEKIVSALDLSFSNVIEFRHESWWNKTVYKYLSDTNITFCGISHPELSDEVICNTSIVYYRFHGVPVLYKSSYGETKLASVINQVKRCRKADQAYIYFNNTWGLAGIMDAQQMEKMLTGKGGKKLSIVPFT